MKEFPWPLRILAGLCLAPALWGILFYSIGMVRPFGSSSNIVLALLLYLLNQLVWLVPVAMFFVSLNEYRRGYNTRAYCCAVAGVALAVISLVACF